jgi:hypothetical protein
VEERNKVEAKRKLRRKRVLFLFSLFIPVFLFPYGIHGSLNSVKNRKFSNFVFSGFFGSGFSKKEPTSGSRFGLDPDSETSLGFKIRNQ